MPMCLGRKRTKKQRKTAALGGGDPRKKTSALGGGDPRKKTTALGGGDPRGKPGILATRLLGSVYSR